MSHLVKLGKDHCPGKGSEAVKLMLSLEINVSSNQEKKKIKNIPNISIIIITSITHLTPPACTGTAYIGGFIHDKAQPN